MEEGEGDRVISLLTSEFKASCMVAPLLGAITKPFSAAVVVVRPFSSDLSLLP